MQVMKEIWLGKSGCPCGDVWMRLAAPCRPQRVPALLPAPTRPAILTPGQSHCAVYRDGRIRWWWSVSDPRGAYRSVSARKLAKAQASSSRSESGGIPPGHGLVDVLVEFKCVAVACQLSWPGDGWRQVIFLHFKPFWRMIRAMTIGLPAIPVFGEGVSPCGNQSLAVIAVAGHAHAPVMDGTPVDLPGWVGGDRRVKTGEVEGRRDGGRWCFCRLWHGRSGCCG